MRTYIALISIFLCTANKLLYAQSKELTTLENRIYNFNNAYKYDSSFNVLRKYLTQPTLTHDDRYYIYLYLSYTNKRIFDYKAVLQNLDSALYWGLRTNQPQYYQANITCQKAFVMFDELHYQAADSLMQMLIKTNYQHLSENDKALILTQQAYLLYQKQAYTQAEQKYRTIEKILIKINPCDLPLIYGKLIQLYNKTNNLPQLYKAYEQGIAAANACDILKYKVYMNQMMYHNLELQKKYALSFVFLKKYDSLHGVYNEHGYQQKINEFKHQYNIERKDLEIKAQEQQQLHLIALVLFLIVGVSVFVFLYFKLKRQNKIILQQNKVNEQVISIISHDIKEPLLAVKLLLKKLNMQDNIMMQVSQSLEQQILSVNHILNSLLEIRKNNAENTANVLTVTKLVVKELDLKINQKLLSVENSLSEEMEIPISPQKLRVILYTILGNAIKYSPENSYIRIYKITHGFAIQDFGAGIPAEKLDILLNDAVISEVGTAQEKGNGMGLYIVGQIVRQSKIAIRFESEENKGTTVYITY